MSTLAAALAGCGGGSSKAGAPPAYGRALEGAPPALAAIYAQGDRLLPGGVSRLEARLRALRGHTVVANVWGSWCGPCREEFPILQRASARLGRRVAFLGIDALDSPAAARTFLSERPLPYPSYEDPHGEARSAYELAGLPATVFFDRRGMRVYVHQGPYQSVAALAADIRRYAR